MDQALNQKIDAYIAQNKEQLLKDIAALVAVNSVEGTPEEGAPYGAGPRAALDKTLELAAGMGLATRNCENYIGYAELAGKDPEKYLATICHVDVVPVGNGWTADPFTMRIQDGWLLGRGVADDKGPMVATLYALKFLKEQGYELRYPIRALAGTGFQNGLQCRKQIGDDPLAVAGNRQQIGAAQHGVKIIAGAKYFRQQPLGALIRLGQQLYGIGPSGALRLHLLFQLLQLVLQGAKTAVNIGVAGVKAQHSAAVLRPAIDRVFAQAGINRKLFHKASFNATEICNHDS